MRRDANSEVRLTADVHAESRYAKEQRQGGEPFIITVLGDFRGSSEGAPARQDGPLGGRKLESIDRDNFDAILARFEVFWEGQIQAAPDKSGASVDVRFPIRALEDFHPDQIVHQATPLRLLLETRTALQDPARFDAVAAEISKWAAPEPAPGKPVQGAGRPTAPPGVTPTELLSLILGENEAKVTPKDKWSEDLQRLLKDAVAPHLVRIDSARQQQLTEAADKELSRQVRAILRDRSFKRLEAAWRSLAWLVGNADTGPDLKILIVQATKDDLLRDMYDHESLQDSGLARLLVEPASIPGGMHPSLLVGDYEFSDDLEDLALLERIGGIAQKLQAPFLAAAGPLLLGGQSFGAISSAAIERHMAQKSSKAWQALRMSPPARWLGLALPRVLCRIPYGAETDRIESFDFEEATQNHEDHVWGNPAFRVAGVVAAAFSSDGWDFDVGKEVARIDGLPFYAREVEGETKAKPCAEMLLTDRAIAAIGESGLIPMVPYQNTDSIALPCIQCLAEPRIQLFHS